MFTLLIYMRCITFWIVDYALLLNGISAVFYDVWKYSLSRKGWCKVHVKFPFIFHHKLFFWFKHTLTIYAGPSCFTKTVVAHSRVTSTILAMAELWAARTDLSALASCQFIHWSIKSACDLGMLFFSLKPYNSISSNILFPAEAWNS